MKRKNMTRNALVTSILALLVCVSMLVGATFAWFTDEVVSGMNIIAAGNLDVELYHGKDQNPVDEVNEGTVLFTDAGGNVIDQWEPGVVAFTNLKVANVGTLALSYRLHLVFGNMNTVTHEGEEYDLSDVLKVAIVDDGFVGDRSTAKDLKYDYTLDSFYLEGELNSNAESDTFGVVVYWAPNSNDYDNIFNMNNDKTTSDGEPLRVDLGVSLFATQQEYENDSFDNTYDEAADKTIAAGEIIYIKEQIDPPFVESFLNNGTLIVEHSIWNNGGRVLTNNGNATLNDVEVNGGNAGTYALVSQGTGAVMTLDDVTLTSGGGAIGVTNGASVTINSGEYKVDSASTSGRYLIYTDGEGSTATVNGGTFSWDKNDNQKRAYVYANAGTTVYINGGTFGKASTRSDYTAGILGNGEVIIKGGTFGFDPTKWVAEGYQAVKNGSNWYVVPDGVSTLAANAAQLQTALDSAVDGSVIYVIGDIIGDVTATQKPDVKVTIEGNDRTFAGVLLVDGKSATYTSAGLTIKDVNFKADSISADACIRLGDGTTATRYTCNVTVENCTFDVPGAVGIKSYTGGDKNVTISGCTATANAHSLAQLKGVDVVLVKGCTVNAVRGINLNNSDNVTITGSAFDVEKYAVRFGESANTGVENFAITDCTLTSANGDGDAVIVLRAGATNANLTLTNTTLNGDIQMTGHENANITVQ